MSASGPKRSNSSSTNRIQCFGFRWIGARAQLIDDHELVTTDAFEYVPDANQFHAEATLVLVEQFNSSYADTKSPVRQANCASAAGTKNPVCAEQLRESDRLQQSSLSARIGAGYEDDLFTETF